MQHEIHCRFCNGPREVQAGLCTGCGSYAANAKDSSKQKNTGIQCPQCGRRKLKKDESTYICLATGCGIQFEPLEFCFADNRPEMNAIKREEFNNRNKRRRCFR